MNEVEEFWAIVEYDWLTQDVEGGSDRLHARGPDMVYDDWRATGATACGLGDEDTFWCIPGMFTRMGAMRCDECCEVTGLPPGKGSPKNDARCREILGMESAEEWRARVGLEPAPPGSP